MTTPEQQARDMLELMGADELIEELANLIAERDALKAELAAIKRGAGEPVAWIVRKVDWSERMSDVIRGSNPPAWADVAHPLYTRPCVSLTEEHVRDFVNDVGLDWQSGWTLDECEPNRYVQLSRAVEAHIKGAK